MTREILDYRGQPIKSGGAGVTSNKDTVMNHAKPKFTVHGVQVWENGVIQGTALYADLPKAREIRDILNEEYARLKVNHQAKIMDYPVY